jgi:hypothetical protein
MKCSCLVAWAVIGVIAATANHALAHRVLRHAAAVIRAEAHTAVVAVAMRRVQLLRVQVSRRLLPAILMTTSHFD